MGATQFVFDNNQLNRLYPYYLLINKDMVIADYGAGLGKLIPNLLHNELTKQLK